MQPKSERPAAFRAAHEADLTVVHRKLFRVIDFMRLVGKVRRGELRRMVAEAQK